MRILVTGGAGFVGSHIVGRLVAAGHDVVAVDLLHPAAHDGPPADLPAGADYRFADLTDHDVAGDAVRGVDAVCHQAAMVGLGVDFRDVEEYVRHNDLATAVMLRALHDRGFAGRVALASSMVVYGEGRYTCRVHGIVRPPARPAERLARGRFEPTCPVCGADLAWAAVSEDTPPDPRNVYAATKLHQEHLVGSYVREHPGTSAAMLRYHNVYGPGMPANTPYAGVASIFRSALERGESPRVLEDGGQCRDFVHVADVARANILALTADAVAGAYNVASGEPHTVLDMANALCDASPGGHTPEVIGGYRIGDVRHVVASPERAARDLGFTAEVPFAGGMADFAAAPLRRAGSDVQRGRR